MLTVSIYSPLGGFRDMVNRCLFSSSSISTPRLRRFGAGCSGVSKLHIWYLVGYARRLLKSDRPVWDGRIVRKLGERNAMIMR